MRKSLWFGSLVLMFLGACSTTCGGCCSSADAQVVVDKVAKENPEVTRLSVHCQQSAGGAMVCASTMAAKKGKPSAAEDLEAMKTGKTIVLDEAGALDVTVPICAKDGKFQSACGVTLKGAGLPREKAVEKATAIAKQIETELCSKGGACCEGGACCSDK